MAHSSAGSSRSLLRRPGCWVTFLGVIPLLIGAVYVIENWHGARALERARGEATAAGLEWDASRIASARPPDAENFFATPLLLSLGAGKAEGPTWDALRRVGSWQGIAADHGARIQSVLHRDATDWAAVRDAIAKGDPDAGLDPNATPANALSMSLGAELLPVLEELGAALDRPYSVLVPTYLDQVHAGQGLHAGGIWMNDLRRLSAALAIHTAILLEGAEPARALQPVRILFKLAEGAENYGGAAATLVGASIRSLVYNLVWSSALRRLMSADVWREMATLLRAQQPLAQFPLALQTETLFSHLAIDQLRGASPSVPTRASRLPSGTEPFFFLVPVLPRGWIDANEAFVLARFARISRQTQDTTRADRFRLSEEDLEYQRFLSHQSMGRLVLSGTARWVGYAASTESIGRIAETACALEAFLADRQFYPPSLADLVPAYLPRLPLDWDAHPIRYAPDPSNQRYRLWSIGLDGIDDGGTEKSRDGSPPKPWGEPVGDWLWQYPPSNRMILFPPSALWLWSERHFRCHADAHAIGPSHGTRSYSRE